MVIGILLSLEADFWRSRVDEDGSFETGFARDSHCTPIRNRRSE